LRSCWPDGESPDEVRHSIRYLRGWESNRKRIANWHAALNTLLTHPEPATITGGSAAYPLFQLVEYYTNFSMDSEEEARRFLIAFRELIAEVEAESR
jgi:hypothetical protein